MAFLWKLNLDGTVYQHIGIGGLQRTASIMEDGNGGWTLNGQYKRSLIGTLYNYTFTLYQMGDAYAAEYDTVYEIITAPSNSHTIVVPYGQSSIELTIYITDVTDNLRWEDENGRLWGAMQVNCLAQAPSRLASGV
jgi:hypothetical protein